MSAFWYYAEGAETIGPVALDALVKMLSLLPDARGVLVWRDGFDDWRAAETVREIAEKLFRPPPVRPPPKPPVNAAQWTPIVAPAPPPAEAQLALEPQPKPSKEEVTPLPPLHRDAVADTPPEPAALLSRSKIALLFFLYFVAAVGLAAFETQPAQWTPFTVLYVIGGGIPIYVIGGILPMIGWAFVGFRAKSAPGPFLIWAVISLAVAVFIHIGNAASSDEKITQMMPNGVLTGKNLTEFISSAKLGCLEKQRANPLTPKIGLSEAKITAYCDCAAVALAAAITIEELRYIVTNGKHPASLVDKGTQLGNSCGQQVLLK